MGCLTFVTAPGLGDCVWSLAKIYHMFSEREIAIKLSDGHPKRSGDLIDLLPVKNLGYVPWRDFPNGALDLDTDLDSLPDGEYYLQCNTGVDAGIKLADIFPKQPTNYHMPFNIPFERAQQAAKFLDTLQGTKIGIYASAYTGESPWDVKDWVYFCSLIRMAIPDVAFYVIGSNWDTRTMDVYESLRQQQFNVTSSIGQHKIGATIEVLKGLDYYFGYPSGLGILCNVVRTNSYMWIYKNFPQGLIDSYADPLDIESHKHINVTTQTPKEAIEYFIKYGLQHIKSNVRELQSIA